MMKKVVSIFLGLLILLFLGPLSEISWASNDFVEDELVCQLYDSSYIEVIYSTYGASIIEYIPQLVCFRLMIQPGLDPESLAVVIEADPNVAYCEANYIFSAPEPVQGSQPFIDVVGDAGAVSSQPSAIPLSLPTIHSTTTGAGVRVGVIDVGVDASHPLLSNAVSTGYDFIEDDTTATDELGGSASGHGTFVAGIINLIAPDAEIIPYRVLDTAGRGDGYSVAEAIVRAIDDGCKVINLSMVMSGQQEAVYIAIRLARINNVVIVCSAGNDSVNIDRFPASDVLTLSVAAIDSLNLKADFSNFGTMISICAPGTQIYSAFPDSSYAWWSGTSFSSPFVTGQIALLFEKNQLASWDAIMGAVINNTINIDSLNPLYSGQLGFGLIDIESSVNSIEVNCGDINGDYSEGNIADLTYLVEFMFKAGPEPANLNSANLDGSADGINISDLTYFVSYLFKSGPLLNCPN